ncbi:hypothetical protein EC973_002519 [Apophysomyces ossiformis]|uniref:F-box domain-containing protein n=1 Tax=Apophysomyces ossiformis TaxID=679940 RepID=A0A8H7BR51_9FUNG|nr:hypothetical protein EC973_002519 [Apophysomyces ossiformis]
MLRDGEQNAALSDHAKSFLSRFGPNSTLKSMTIGVSSNCLLISPILQHVSQLTSLELVDVGDFSLGNLTQLHECCPHLRSLSLNEVIFRNGTITGEHKVLPTHIEAVTIEYYSPWEEPALWLDYFAARYPHLKRFRIRKKSPPYAEPEPEVADSMRRLKQGCRQLKDIQLIDMHWCHKYLEPLLDLDPKANIVTLTVTFNGAYEQPFCKAISGMTWHRIRKLSLFVDWPLLPITVLSALQPLHLEELNIGDSRVKPRSSPRIRLDQTFTHLRHLSVLRIYHAELTKHETEEPITADQGQLLPHDNLQKLVLSEVLLDQEVIDFLAAQCPRIRYLRMDGCAGHQRASGEKQNLPFLHLHLPHRKLHSIQIRSFTMCSRKVYKFKSSRTNHIRLCKVVQGNELHWIHISAPTMDSLEYLKGPRPYTVWSSSWPPRVVDQASTKQLERLTSGAAKRLLARALPTSSSQNWEAELGPGYLVITCESIDNLYIDDHRVSLP